MEIMKQDCKHGSLEKISNEGINHQFYKHLQLSVATTY